MRSPFDLQVKVDQVKVDQVLGKFLTNRKLCQPITTFSSLGTFLASIMLQLPAWSNTACMTEFICASLRKVQRLDSFVQVLGSS